KQFDKVVGYLQEGDFSSADVKKMQQTGYYRAKLDKENRLLFSIGNYEGQKYIFALEVILNHAYDKSRFLNGAEVDENKLEAIKKATDVPEEEVQLISYVNPQLRHFYLLDKILSFDTLQESIFQMNPPLILIGSAGSGKTMLTLEKMKQCLGEVLYVTGSDYLVQNARQLYYANYYSNEDQEVDFLSYREFCETIQVPQGKEMDFPQFSAWLSRSGKLSYLKEANKLYEEFKGVLTGNALDKRFLSKEDYLTLGVKQSIYPANERDRVYDLFHQYLALLQENHLYESNLISYDYLTLSEPKYDFIVVDEVQDFTPIQLLLILKSLKLKQQFLLCGDANQIVHPNFFSWAKIKSLFYHQASDYSTEVIRILNKNYRNAPNVTAIANKLLKAKNARFGSIDKESHYLVESQSSAKGEVYCLLDNEAIRQEINIKTQKSTHFAIIVLRDDLKEQVSRYFQTPLVFSIYEAKGLEYDNVILYHFISSEEKSFREVVQGVTKEDLKGDLVYGRVKDKADRSLEIYKFFVNALYVAITRAIKNVYFIEIIEQHPLLNILGLHPTKKFTAIDAQASSLDDWQKEARRLELQGKQAQADAIRETILCKKTVPWSVLTPKALVHLREKALNQQKKDKEARLLLFEYALYYHQPSLMDELIHVEFAPAMRPKKDYQLLQHKYFTGYYSSNTTSVMRDVSAYGVDFRTIFNQTSLMTACNFGNSVLAKQLIEKGADPYLTDNVGKNAFQIVLQKACLDKRFATEKLAPLYECNIADTMRLQSDNKLITLNDRRMEFFLVNMIMATAHQRPQRNHIAWSFNVDVFLEPLQYFPAIMIPENRKRRAYISSILSKHEVNRKDLYNKKLFVRVRHGRYVLNPDLLIKIENEWQDIYTLLNLSNIKEMLLFANKVHEQLSEKEYEC
ncbi:MAG: hypothetical protein LRY67_01715, partial [Gammaproteobacteria bacterium]|nr:hypothetical protein [Gammaproteobacteria bacterium]